MMTYNADAYEYMNPQKPEPPKRPSIWDRLFGFNGFIYDTTPPMPPVKPPKSEIRKEHEPPENQTISFLPPGSNPPPPKSHDEVVQDAQNVKSPENIYIGLEVAEERGSPLNKQVGGDHYKKLKIQPVEYNHANGLDFFQGSVVKYITRFRDKNGKADLEKAKHFIELLIELEYGKTTHTED